MKAMKSLLLVLVASTLTLKARAQAAEAQQLLLNWEKLTQLKAILQNMYDGYTILEEGYSAVKDLSEGNFSLHKTFLDGLLEVSPTVRNYHRVADIIRLQVRILSEAKGASNQLGEKATFNPDEIKYLAGVYTRLLKKSAEQLDELALVLTAGTLRMSDDERLRAIDRIYTGVLDQYSFLRDFNNRAALLSGQRLKEQTEIELSRKLHGY